MLIDQDWVAVGIGEHDAGGPGRGFIGFHVEAKTLGAQLLLDRANVLESGAWFHAKKGDPRRNRGFHGTIGGMDGERADQANDDAEGRGTEDRETAYDLLQRGNALLEQRHFAQAAIVLERANKQEPAKGSILEALGRAYFNSGQAERARETFEALLEVDPSSHYAHYAVGQSLKRLGQPDRARTHLRLAVALSPTNKLYRGALDRLQPKTDA